MLGHCQEPEVACVAEVEHVKAFRDQRFIHAVAEDQDDGNRNQEPGGKGNEATNHVDKHEGVVIKLKTTPVFDIKPGIPTHEDASQLGLQDNKHQGKHQGGEGKLHEAFPDQSNKIRDVDHGTEEQEYQADKGQVHKGAKEAIADLIAHEAQRVVHLGVLQHVGAGKSPPANLDDIVLETLQKEVNLKKAEEKRAQTRANEISVDSPPDASWIRSLIFAFGQSGKGAGERRGQLKGANAPEHSHVITSDNQHYKGREESLRIPEVRIVVPNVLPPDPISYFLHLKVSEEPSRIANGIHDRRPVLLGLRLYTQINLRKEKKRKEKKRKEKKRKEKMSSRD